MKIHERLLPLKFNEYLPAHQLFLLKKNWFVQIRNENWVETVGVPGSTRLTRYNDNVNTLNLFEASNPPEVNYHIVKLG